MALTSTYTTISSAQTDADSPLDTTLMEAIRQNLDVLYEWMGGPTYTPSTSHNHDGANSRPITGTALALLSTASMAGATSVDLSTIFMSTIYDNFRVSLVSFRPSVANSSLRFQFYSTSALSSAATYRYAVNGVRSNANSTVMTSAGDSWAIIGDAVATAYTADGTIDVFLPSGTKLHSCSFSMVGTDNTNALWRFNGGFHDSATAARGGFRIVWNDLSSALEGKVLVYGVRNST